MRSSWRLEALLLLVLLAAGCGGAPPETGAKSYPLKGRVVAVDPAERTVTIDHEDIEGFMPAMTMDFVVLEKDAALLDGVSPGDEVTARLVAPDSRYWIEDLLVVKKGTPDPNAPHPAHTHLAEPGDVLPDVALVDQDGEELHLSDFRGRALALTFIFTRCPLADYCPLMMKNFSAVQDLLLADDDLAQRTQLLTVSFDPEHDTPAVLRSFGERYQKTSPPFTQWKLATGTDEAIRALAEPLGLEYMEETRSFTHNLRTAVFDDQGHLRRVFHGNDWTPEELAAELREATASD